MKSQISKLKKYIFIICLFSTFTANSTVVNYVPRDTNSLLIGTFQFDTITQGIVQSNLNWNPSWLIEETLPVTSFSIANMYKVDSFYGLTDKNNQGLNIDINFEPVLIYTNPGIYFWTRLNFTAYDANGVMRYSGAGTDISWFDIAPSNQANIPSVPEPSTTALLIIGLLLIGFSRRQIKPTK